MSGLREDIKAAQQAMTEKLKLAPPPREEKEQGGEEDSTSILMRQRRKAKAKGKTEEVKDLVNNICGRIKFVLLFSVD